VRKIVKHFSNAEKLAVVVSSCVLATAALLVALKMTVAPSYADFIVGHVTWSATTKLQDLIAAPVFIAVLFFAFLFLSLQLEKQKQQFGNDYARQLSSQLIWWSIPTFAAIFSLVLGAAFDKKLLAISAAGTIFIVITSNYNTLKKLNVNPKIISLSAFATILTGLIPLEIALVLGRAPMKMVGDINLAYYEKATYVAMGLGLVLALFYAMRYPTKLSQLLPKLVLIGQLGLPILFLSLYPARLLPPNGVLTKYDTTVSLKILLGVMIVWGVSDAVRRYSKYSATNDWTRLLSPIGLFALLVGLKIGNTIPPHISPDDYHFGERLLGWWSYLEGTIPYVGYVPAHGLIDDDLTQFLSYYFYDGSAGSVAEVERLSITILAFAAFISIYLFSGSIGLAFVSVFFIGERLTWLFLTPFLCLWFSRSLSKNPASWLSIWMLTTPIVILGVPPQGLLLVAASGVMAASFTWRFLRNSEEREWKDIGISLTILIILGFTTPLASMLFGAIRYVLENGPINQVAYGVPWALSWNSGAGSGFVFEAIRMSWVAIPMACLAIIYASTKDQNHRKNVLFPAIVVLLFSLLLIPYSMGRIDPGAVSRSGRAAIFGWAILLPIVAWGFIKLRNRIPLILLVACMSASLNYSHLSFSSLVSAASSRVGTGPLRDAYSAGMPNIGKAYVQDEQWDRLTRLNALLEKKLTQDETYLDLTSRNAQYFYLNRRPITAVTAPYNMASPSQQRRAIEQLAQNLPRLALLDGANIIHDGGGLALRNPYLYRFILDNYSPMFEDGFIIGYKKMEMANGHELKIDASVKNLTDANWDRGISRREPAVIVADPVLTSFLTTDMQVRIGTGDTRKIKRIQAENNVIWLDGPAINPNIAGYPNRLQIAVNPQIENEYRVALFEKAFAQSDLGKIPVAWGRSEKSLQKKMTLIHKFDGFSPTLHQLISEDESYKPTGPDPQLNFDISSLSLAGRNAGLLRFDFSCMKKSADPRIQVFWWGDDREGSFEASSIRFTADDGTLIVPLDASPRWMMTQHIKGIRIDLDIASACNAFRVRDIGLFQRHLADDLLNAAYKKMP
jgi:hypothetical protein